MVMKMAWYLIFKVEFLWIYFVAVTQWLKIYGAFEIWDRIKWSYRGDTQLELLSVRSLFGT